MRAAPEVQVKIEQVRVTLGQTLTVWLQRDDNDDPMKCDMVQVELRVDRTGKPEIFVRNKDVVKSFDDWTSL